MEDGNENLDLWNGLSTSGSHCCFYLVVDFCHGEGAEIMADVRAGESVKPRKDALLTHKQLGRRLFKILLIPMLKGQLALQ